MKIDTRIVDNFLTNNELSVIEEMVMKIPAHENFNKLHDGSTVKSGDYYVFDYYDTAFKKIKDILDPKLEAEFGPDLFMEQIHIFDCVDPYTLHSDIASGWKKSLQPTDPAWTLIIPLDDFDSHTVVFNEGSNVKDPYDYIKNIPPYDPCHIDEEIIKKYFGHIPDKNIFNWLTIENVFKWKKGAMFAADRFKFHTSDDFLGNGIPSKKAIIAWTRVNQT